MKKYSQEDPRRYYYMQYAAYWNAVKQEIIKPYPPQLQTQILTSCITPIVSAAKQLKEYISIIREYDFSQITKTLQMFKSASNNPFKKEGSNPLTSAFWKGVPWIGPVLGTLMCLKNIYYGMYEFGKIINSATNLNTDWTYVLSPSYLQQISIERKNNPRAQYDIVIAAKSDAILCDEAVSFVANILDGAKDIIFTILDLSGWMVLADIGISVIIAMIEYFTETALKNNYDPILAQVDEICETQLDHLEKLIEEEDYRQTLYETESDDVSALPEIQD